MSLHVFSDNNLKMELAQDNSEWPESTDLNSHMSQGDYMQLEEIHEDACTQTDGFSICKSVPMVDGPEMELPFESQDGTETGVLSLFDSGLVSPPLLHRGRGTFYFKEKTSNLFKSMKEKHRENERLRHHSLNQHLRNICKSVPGSAEDGKETKVVMMQRIISYMSYLENTIKSLCYQLDVNPLQRWVVLTSSLKDIENAGTWKKEFSVTPSEDSEDSTILSSSSLRVKLSSPTIDSTTDPTTSDSLSSVLQPLSDSCSPSGIDLDLQEAIVPSCPTILPDNCDGVVGVPSMEWVPSTKGTMNDTEPFDALLGCGVDFQDRVYEFASTAMEHKLIESPCEVKWLGSPDKSPNSFQGKFNNFGIKCDPQSPDDQACDLTHTVVVSPDKVMPIQLIQQPAQGSEVVKSQTSNKSVTDADLCLMKAAIVTSSTPETKPGNKASCSWDQSVPTSNCWKVEEPAADVHTDGDTPSWTDDCQIVPLRSNKRKQSSPRRAPLFNITNCSQEATPSEFDVQMREASAWIKKESSVNELQVETNSDDTLDPQHFHEVLKEEIKSQDNISEMDISLEEECAKVLKEARIAVRSKLDLRKSSWMNGFMMYSRIHRKRFIRSNPGFHTAVISKLMGHAWRAMSSEEQRPYTEKAKVCAQELQKMLDANCQALSHAS